MKINCTHGFFTFEEVRAGEASDFVSLFGLQLARWGRLFTFAALAEAPNYSIKGAPLMDAVATVHFEGEPGEVFRANGMVFNYDLGLLVPITSIVTDPYLSKAGNYYLSPGLIMPGSISADGKRVTDYAAWYSADTGKFKYSEVTRG